jgi:hypothetical protein
MTRADRVHSTPPLRTPIDTTRRHLLTVTAASAIAAAIPAAALAAVSAVDPVFELIEAHQATYAVHMAAISEADRLAEVHGASGPDWGRITEKPCDDENDAFAALLEEPATTLPGLIAKLEYLRGIAESDDAWRLYEDESTPLALIGSFTASLKNIGVLS